MTIIETIILGIIQGLTEFIPVSSSGHLKIGEAILGVQTTESLQFTIVVHGATVLSTLIVFKKDIVEIFRNLFTKSINPTTHFALKIGVSMIPIAIVGLFFKNSIEAFFDSMPVSLVGLMLMITGLILMFAWLKKSGNEDVSYWKAFIIGIAQVIAIIPGISRSGATIGTAILLKIDREKAARFSFLMVIVPILGEMVLDIAKGEFVSGQISTVAMLAGFLSAFLAGLFACRFMINIVKHGKLIYFAIYCLLIGVFSVLMG
ncbi:MAG TPA: undecaprenyl-diphosphate phosphatase [Salinivirgaceae bacterium]|nr:undecaprenyl-diphosphate phosphatase [Salinivirgaceae bacterium]